MNCIKKYMNCSLFLILFFLASPLFSYEYNYDQKIQYQFPIQNSDTEKLKSTLDLMSFFEIYFNKNKDKIDPQSRFQWNFDWNQNYIGAGSNFLDKTFSVMLYGGMVRAEGANFQFLALVLCHEFGHFLGGLPKQRLINKNVDEWSSSEGQSDWYAGSVCLPEVFDYLKIHKPEAIQLSFPSESESFCISSNDKKKCQWIVSAALDFVLFSDYYFDRLLIKPSLFNKAPEQPAETLHSVYPTLQCRLDTFKAAALCATQQDKTNCERPRCWYNQ